MEWILAVLVLMVPTLGALAACMRSSQLSQQEEAQEAAYRKRHVRSPNAD